MFVKGKYQYPKNWTEEEQIRFDNYYSMSKQVYPKMEDYLIEMAVYHQIQTEKGLYKEVDFNELDSQISVSS